jgi:hypothetical protein
MIWRSKFVHAFSIPRSCRPKGVGWQLIPREFGLYWRDNLLFHWCYLTESAEYLICAFGSEIVGIEDRIWPRFNCVCFRIRENSGNWFLGVRRKQLSVISSLYWH